MKNMLQFILAALLLMSGLAIGASAGSEGVVVTNAWSRASIGSGRPGAAYMEIRNTGDEPVTLTGLRTDLAMMAEIHRTSTNAQGVTSMAPAGEIVIAPGETIERVMTRLEAGDEAVTVSLDDGSRLSCGKLVVAAGAWSGWFPS